MEPSRLGKVLVGLSEAGLGQPLLMQEVDTSALDSTIALKTLATEYAVRAVVIRRDLVCSHLPDFVEQAVQRQNDEALEGLLAEAEAEVRQVGLARLHLAEGHHGYCKRCGEAIEPAHSTALPAVEYCLRCTDPVYR